MAIQPEKWLSWLPLISLPTNPRQVISLLFELPKLARGSGDLGTHPCTSFYFLYLFFLLWVQQSPSMYQLSRAPLDSGRLTTLPISQIKTEAQKV